MKRTLAAATAFLALSATSALAQPPTPSPDCLRQINIWDYKAMPGNRSLIVIDKSRRKYLVQFMGICPNLKFHNSLAFKTNGTSQLSCVDKGDSVLVRDPVGPNRCVIKSVGPYTAVMEKADADAAAAAKAH